LKASNTVPPTTNGRGKKPGAKTRANVKKWTQTVLDPGFTWVPNVLLLKQEELGLDSVDLNILLQLACHWWKSESPPYLSKKTIARRIGRDPSTVRRRITNLVARGFIDRIRRNGKDRAQRVNAYSLKPLVLKLHPFAVALKKARAEKRKGRTS
jgi:DNA replication protein DnaD